MIVVIVDQFIKMIWLKAMMTTVLLQEITKIYWDEIWKLHEVSRNILNNRKLQFVSKFMEELSKALETKRTLSMAYYSQTNGQTERINQEIETFL